MFVYEVQEQEIAFASPVALVCPPCAVNLNTCWKVNWRRASQFRTWAPNQRRRCISAPAMEIHFKLHFLSVKSWHCTDYKYYYWPSEWIEICVPSYIFHTLFQHFKKCLQFLTFLSSDDD